MKQAGHEYTQFIHIGDFIRFIRRRKKKYLLIALGCACASMGIFGLLDPQYILHASFKEASIRNENSSVNTLKTLLKTSSNVDLGTQALSVMKSRQLLGIVIQELHVQGEVKLASVKEKLKMKVMRRFQTNHRHRPLCLYTDLRYTGKEIKRFNVKANASGALEVYSLQTKRALIPSIDKKYREEELTFSLEMDLDWETSPKELLLAIYPLETTIDKCMSKLKVKVRRDDATMLDLVYRDTDPLRGTELVNALMKEYKKYLFKENERIAEAQLSYLTRRQHEIAGKLDEILQTHVDYLEHHLNDQGLMGLHQELEIIEGRKKRHQQRMLEIDFEVNKLGKIKGDHLFTVESFSPEGKKLQQELMGLRKQKESLALAEFKRSAAVAQKNKLQESTRGRSHLRMHQTDYSIHMWEERQHTVDQAIAKGPHYVLPVFSSLKQNLAELYYHKDQQAHTEVKPLEFQGMNLEMARQLHLEYTHALDETLMIQKELQLALDHIHKEQFEVSSLTHLIGEGAPQEMARETTKLSTDLKNEHYFSDKDRERMREQIKRNKNFLKNHFLDKLYLAKLRSELMIEKIASVQQTIGDLITEEIMLVEEQMQQILQEQLTALEEEKNYIQKKLGAIQEELKTIPQKWLMENRLQLQSDLNISMMEGMSQLVESKNIEHHLLQVESKPIDQAYVPLKPQQGSLLLYGILGAVVGLLSSLSVSIGTQIIRGFPVSIVGLRFRGFQTVGPFPKKLIVPLEQFSHAHLEMLRSIAAFVSHTQTIGVILNAQINYSKELGELLRVSGKTVLIIELFSRASSTIGLLDYLTGNAKELIIEKQGVLDVIPLGSSSPYKMEILSRNEWKTLLMQLQKSYQVVLLVTEAEVHASEAKQLLDYSQKMVITLDEESLDDLYPYMQQEEAMHDSFALYVAFE